MACKFCLLNLGFPQHMQYFPPCFPVRVHVSVGGATDHAAAKAPKDAPAPWPAAAGIADSV